MKRYMIFIATSGLAIALMVLVASLRPTETSASPPLAPTPVANILASDQAAFFRIQPALMLTADTNTSGRDVLGFNSLDIQYIVDVDANAVNTTTLTIQYSNDNTNWDNGVALGTLDAATGDHNDITRIPIFGRYVRINQDVTNTDDITITLLAVGR